MTNIHKIYPPNWSTLYQSVNLLNQGELVAFPTETVYGLGADATNEQAVSKIFAIKNRPHFNPLITHVAEVDQARDLAVFNDQALELARYFWPGPLTLVLNRQKNCSISSLACAGLDTIAIRIPRNPTAQNLLIAFDKPIVAPSANLSGKVSPTTAAHVSQALSNKIDIIIDGGNCEVGIESTIINLTQDIPVLLRPGAITLEQLKSHINILENASKDIRAPGMLSQHYAPDLPLRLNVTEVYDNEALLAFGSPIPCKTNVIKNLSLDGNLEEAAINLFSMLRDLDQSDKVTSIAVMPIPENGLGMAINDRLRRAAARS
ncbi:MAG: threonylcarbamoyl-AMP synthase [Alphaproteobacteria bacterium]|nr:threonylcarbamoyl-AMP synthase [Alphaproteobacteria bacterium]